MSDTIPSYQVPINALSHKINLAKRLDIRELKPPDRQYSQKKNSLPDAGKVCSKIFFDELVFTGNISTIAFFCIAKMIKISATMMQKWLGLVEVVASSKTYNQDQETGYIIEPVYRRGANTLVYDNSYEVSTIY